MFPPEADAQKCEARKRKPKPTGLAEQPARIARSHARSCIDRDRRGGFAVAIKGHGICTQRAGRCTGLRRLY
jgi:hypothetical protein